MEESEALIREIQKGILQWYTFAQDSVILYIGNKEEALVELLSDRSSVLVCASCEESCSREWQEKYRNSFDYIVSIEELEHQKNPQEILCIWYGLLKTCGKLLLGMNNRFGIRYFCGDKDPYTGRNFDGVEGYRRAYVKKEDDFLGRCFNRSELKSMLGAAGWDTVHFFSVFPDLKNPCLLYEENYLPNEDLANRVFPMYNNPNTVFLEEAPIYRGLIENGMFHQMANAYLIECPVNGNCCKVAHVTGSMERGKNNSFFTIIYKSGIVEKRAAYSEGKQRLEALFQHTKDLKNQGISVIDIRIEGEVCIMPYVKAEVGQLYLKRLLKTDKEKFLQKMDYFRDLILKSSDIVKSDVGDGEGAILRWGYLDMVPLNSFYMNGTFVFFDQEFRKENYPANAIIIRMINTFYAGDMGLHKLLPMEFLFKRYGLMKNFERWRIMEWEFLSELRNYKQLCTYYKAHRCDSATVNANRQRMNYSADEYQRLFIDIFHNADTRKLILFGSGKFAEKFLELYHQDYPVYAVVDNNEEKWGQKLEGITIQSPMILRKLQSGEYKVIICIKNYLSVMNQLREMGVSEFSIYDAGRMYPRKRNPITQAQVVDSEKIVSKKYHTGYIAGVFDLFHVGHLNMFRRAKEQCDYLIVGVVSDEGVRKNKKVEPFVPFEERIEMVRACRYVDEAVEIPLNYYGTIDAYRLHRFDCQFSGSDYIDDPIWLEQKKLLEEHGAEMVFFPYTENTSSSKIKELIEKKLL